MAQQPNHYFGPSIRNSYGYQDQSNNRPNMPIKTFQPYTSSFQHQNKLSNTIKAMESRVDGVEALVRQKKNSINQDNIKSPILNGPNNTFQVYEPVKFSNGFSVNTSSSNLGEQRSIQLRGSCPNIFKKLDQTGSNLRSTTQFLNMGKWGLNSNNISNDPSRKQSTNEEAQSTVPRPMKKHQLPFMNDQQSTTNFTSQSSKLLNTDSFAVSKAQTFNPNKSLSSGQLPSFRYNLNNTLNKSNINNNRDKLQKQTHSPARIVANRTPTKFSKLNNVNTQSDKRSPQASLKNIKSTSNQNSLSASIATDIRTSPNIGVSQFEQKKFKSLHEIWEIKQKQKTQKKISESIKTNSIQKSKIINGFEIGKVLGKGKFGEVYLARHHQTGFITAIKKIVKSKVKQYKMIDQFSKQIKLHSALDHPNIVKFYGFFQENDDIYLVIEYMNGGTLFDYLNEVYHLGVKETIQYLRDIIEAIVYLHEKSIAHRDIKPENIVISTEGVAKLCDFGWSAVIQTSRKTYCGTFDYAPPQILQRKNYDMSVDVWCIGVLTYELLTGRVPFEGDKRNQIMQKIVNVDKNKIQYPIDIPKQAKDFIELLVQKDPNLRPKPSQLLKHPFFSLCPPKVKSKKLQ